MPRSQPHQLDMIPYRPASLRRVLQSHRLPPRRSSKTSLISRSLEEPKGCPLHRCLDLSRMESITPSRTKLLPAIRLRAPMPRTHDPIGQILPTTAGAVTSISTATMREVVEGMAGAGCLGRLHTVNLRTAQLPGKLLWRRRLRLLQHCLFRMCLCYEMNGGKARGFHCTCLNEVLVYGYILFLFM
jgi:hypothetical protein